MARSRLYRRYAEKKLLLTWFEKLRIKLWKHLSEFRKKMSNVLCHQPLGGINLEASSNRHFARYFSSFVSCLKRLALTSVDSFGIDSFSIFRPPYVILCHDELKCLEIPISSIQALTMVINNGKREYHPPLRAGD